MTSHGADFLDWKNEVKARKIGKLGEIFCNSILRRFFVDGKLSNKGDVSWRV